MKIRKGAVTIIMFKLRLYNIIVYHTALSTDGSIFSLNVTIKLCCIIIPADGISRLRINNHIGERKIVCELPSDPINGPKLCISNSKFGISCEKQFGSYKESSSGDLASGCSFIVVTNNGTMTVLIEGRLNTLNPGTQDACSIMYI